uniref:Large ribosomal subunit protein uL2m n=1 Tax=Nitzschia sp. (in: diatoms) TaxID=1884248 RepID=A0A5J6DUT6_9STRA|nr:ribosomal protein L2 [Nitzschia sp. (in: diatoms)]
MNYKFYITKKKKKISIFSDITKAIPEKTLIIKNHKKKGRNNRGIITIRHRGGGHKKKYRLIDFKRLKYNIKGIVHSIEYDPNRNAKISLINYIDGIKKYILYPNNLKIGDTILSGLNAPLNIGSTLPLEKIPVGKSIHNIELIPGKGGQLVRAAGTYARILAKNNKYVIVKLPSKEIRFLNKNCFATLGKIGNENFHKYKKRKAGQIRWLGKRPIVRGTAMNPCDHPHGGGEGRTPIGRINPKTPWGKPALGIKTRKNKNKSNLYILKKY